MMLKFIFWILLLANAGLLAYQQGYFDTMFPSGREPVRLKNQLQADKVKLIPPPPPVPEPAPVAAPETPVALAQETPESTEANEVKASAEAKEARKPILVACAEIGNFNPDEAKRFTTQVASAAIGEHVSQRSIQEVASHMVYIPPQADKESAEKKAGELRRMGVEDFFIIQDSSSMRWGISLGVFKQEEAARAHLANLAQKGVRSARIGQRTVTSSQVAFQLRDLDADAKRAFDKIMAEFPKQELRGCEKR
ncbi:MAG TPA: SPOR domain-containing protein [Noviherbaspirillum sp.]